MKLFATFTPSHVDLLPLFLSQLDPDFTVQIIPQTKVRGTGAYDTEDYYRAIRNRTSFIIESLKKADDGEIIVWSDVDVFLNGLSPKQVLRDFEPLKVPFACQRLGYKGKLPCFGFMVMRKTDQVIAFWEEVLSQQLKQLDKHDQWVGHEILNKGRMKWEVLPDTYYSGCMLEERPKNYLLHHACCVETVQDKANVIYALLDERAERFHFFSNNPDFALLFCNKNVAVVGGAKENEPHKDLIEKMDLVVRFNNFHEVLPFDEELQKLKGSRTDVLIRECNDWDIVFKTTENMEGYAKALIDAGVRHVFFFEGNGDPHKAAKELREVSGEKFLVTVLSRQVFDTLSVLIGEGKFPTTGLLGLTAIATARPKHVFVSGMTFHNAKRELFAFKHYVRHLSSMTLSDSLQNIL